MKTESFVYPAIFHPEESDFYSVFLPDFGGVATCGEGLADAMYMARDLLFCLIDSAKVEGGSLPKATDIKNVTLENEDDFVSLVDVNLTQYEKFLAELGKNSV